MSSTVTSVKKHQHAFDIYVLQSNLLTGHDVCVCVFPLQIHPKRNVVTG